MLNNTDAALPQQLEPLVKHCDYEAIHAFAVLSDDFNPIHVDREFAAASPMGGIIAHGPMSLGLLIQVLNNALANWQRCDLALDVSFRRPVRENDTITAGGKLVDGTQQYAVWVKNQDGHIVVEGVANLVTASFPPTPP